MPTPPPKNRQGNKLPAVLSRPLRGFAAWGQESPHQWGRKSTVKQIKQIKQKTAGVARGFVFLIRLIQ